VHVDEIATSGTGQVAGAAKNHGFTSYSAWSLTSSGSVLSIGVLRGSRPSSWPRHLRPDCSGLTYLLDPGTRVEFESIGQLQWSLGLFAQGQASIIAIMAESVRMVRNGMLMVDSVRLFLDKEMVLQGLLGFGVGFCVGALLALVVSLRPDWIRRSSSRRLVVSEPARVVAACAA
jgi:hypothetical protein